MSGFLCSMVGASFTVAAAAEVLRSKKAITALGNAQVDTAQSKFGGSSALFDGTGDYLIVPASNDFAFGTGNWTIECWFRRIADASGAIDVIVGNRNAGFASGNIALYTYSSSVEFDYRNDLVANNTLTTTISNNIWYHFAVVRNGTSYTLFKDGAVAQTKTIGASETFGLSTLDLSIGCNTVGTFPLNGYIDELRISNSARYTANFTPDTSPFVNDSTTLLLIHANGTDASTVFEDDNGVRLQRGIEARAGTAVSTTQSKFGGTSMSFGSATGGGGKYAYVNQSYTDFYFGGGYTGDRTYECWVYLTAYTPSGAPDTGEGAFPILTLSRGTDGYVQWCFGINESGYLGVDYSATAGYGGTTYANTSTTLALNTWHHIAMVWQDSGNVIGLYANGTRLVNQSSATEPNWGGSIFGLYIGGHYWTPTGFIDEVRISNTARYTANFTPSTTAFVNDANTLLLVHADGTDGSTVFRDDNGATPPTTPVYNSDAYSSYLKLAVPFTSTVNDVAFNINTSLGSAATVTQGAGSTISGGGTFGNYANSELNTRSGAALTYAIPGGIPTSASGTYVVEGWFAATDATTNNNWVLSSADTNGRWILGLHTGTTNQFASENWYGFNDKNWHHVAIVCDAGTKRFYVDGVYKAAFATGNTGFSTLHVGQFNASSASANYLGRIQDLRVYVGTNKGYTGTNSSTANFALPGPIQGARTQKGIQAVGNAQVDTAQSKFGGTSALFDGTGDYLQIANSSDYNFTGNYTIEGWWYQASNVAAGIYPTLIATGAVGDNKGWQVSSEPTTNRINYITSPNGSSAMSVLLTSANLSAATWNHWAIVRNNSVLTLYINGTASGSTYTTTGNSIASTYPLYIGGGIGGLSSGTFSSSSATVVNLNGYLDEIRVSNTARYTAAFTPSTTPFQNDANTVLLLHMDGSDASTAFFDDNGIAPYTP